MDVSFDNSYISPRFRDRLLTHVYGATLPITKTPLVLAIQGTSGEGKTFQCRRVAETEGMVVRSIFAADLGHELEGKPVERLRQIYVSAAGESALRDRAAVLIIDDFDLSIASTRQDTTYTVNTQLLISFLMSLCDDPLMAGSLKRQVAVVITGNDFRNLHGPLTRHGRMDFFEWTPTREEKIEVVRHLLMPAGSESLAPDLVETFPDMSVAFFASVVRQHSAHVILSVLSETSRPVHLSRLEKELRGILNGGSKASKEVRQTLIETARAILQEQTRKGYLE